MNSNSEKANIDSIIDQFYGFKVIEEVPEEERHFDQVVPQPDQTQIQKMLDDSLQKRQEFIQSNDCKEYSQMLIISQIRMDFTNDDPFLKHLMNVEKAIKKAIRNILLQLQKLENKQQFKEACDKLIKIFYQDINIGFITSTGQIKSTAYAFILKSIIELINRKKINLQFKKIPLKITLTFFAIDSFQQIIPAQKIYDPRNAFIKNNKFFNDYIILSQTNQDELRNGISIFFVYRPEDDQIYALKRSKLQATQLDFFSVFSTTASNSSITPDIRKIREAKILSKLTHPNILRLFAWWIEQTNDGYYLYMQLEYCSFPGYKYQPTDLLTFSYYYLNVMQNSEKINKIKSILNQILDGLEYIHQRGIIHRDLKPENIFVTINIKGDLQVVLADFDQGKDVREEKLSTMTDERLPQEELNSITSQNTITTGTCGYQTANYVKDSHYGMADEFYAIGIILLHLVIAFPGEPKNRNHYAKTFVMANNAQDVLTLFDTWANRFVKNKSTDFSFTHYENVMVLAKLLTSSKKLSHADVRKMINEL
ncbi:unnamed protein product [Paramecium primaurelia]|uniref:Protein kinase domain-containing protein n=1 Tax=Paramecium primaurelia TaxID=5886 RepID=A0A8S1P304_PARPR|nr:unnamed protein product [Paramecium primaurelia]